MTPWLSADAPTSADSLEPPADAWDLITSEGELNLSRASVPETLRGRDSLWLVALVEREGREPTLASLELTVIPEVTWSGDIAPIFDRSCSTCHDDRGGAQRLDEPERWVGIIDDIILVIESQSMPIGLPPLTSDEVSLVRRWRGDGFPQ